MATSNQEKMNKMKSALEYQVKHFASNSETAKKFGVTSGTIVKWRNQIAEVDQRLYHYSKLVADQYNSTKQKMRTNTYVHIIAHLIVRYHLTLEQAITLSGYKIAPARVSTLLSKSIEKEFYQQVKAVLNEYNGTKTTEEQRERFDTLLERQKRLDDEFYQLPHAQDILNVANDILAGEKIEKVAKKYQRSRSELLDDLMELLPIIDYDRYLKVVIQLDLFPFLDHFEQQNNIEEQEPISYFRR